MKIKTTLFLGVLAGMFFISACVSRHPQSLIQPDSGVPMDPDIVYGRLDNGFQYILQENILPEKRIEIHLNIFAGSMHETDEQQGVAHYLEHMLFNGSTHFPPGELIKYFQSIGMDFGADANAHTSFFNTVYDLSLPDNTAEQIEKALTIMDDYAQGALLLPSEVDRERGVILSEKMARDSVAYRTFKETLAFELPGSRFTRRFPIGTEAVLKNADQKVLKSYYDQWYRPDNMVLIVVGDFDAQQMEKMISKRFSKLVSRAGKFSPSMDSKWQPHEGVKTFYHYEPEAGSTDVTIETIVWEPFQYQTVDSQKKNMLQMITNTILQNRLSRMVNRRMADFSEASAYSGSFLHNIRLAAVNAVCDPGEWPSVLQQIQHALQQAIKFGFKQKELDRVKSDIVTSLERVVEQVQTRKTSQISKKILTTINRRGVLWSTLQKKDILKPYIEAITLDDVNKAIQSMWSESHRLVVVTGNAEILSDTPEKEIYKTFMAGRDQVVEKYSGFESKVFPYLPLPSDTTDIKEVVQERVDNVDDLGITRIIFKNSTVVNLKSTDYKKNEFKFNVGFGVGKRSEPIDKPGLSILSQSVINNSGLGSMDGDQLEEALSGKDVSMGFHIHDNYFSFSGSASPARASLVFQLIYHYLKDPGIRKEALELAKIQYRQTYDSHVLTPDGVMQIKGDAFLANGDSRFGLPHPDVIDLYTLEDIKNWLLPDFKHRSLEVSIAGEFGMEEMRDLAAQYLGSLAKREKLSKTDLASDKISFPESRDLTLSIDSKVDSGVVRLAFLTDDFWDISQTRRMMILSRVLSERLRISIREELGETYSPYAYNDPSVRFDDYGVLHLVVNVKPENADFVYDKIKEIIVALNSGDITSEELQIALKPVLNHLKIIRKTNKYWLNSVMAGSSVFPEKFGWARNMISDYEKISVNDLNQLAVKFLDMEKRAKIIITSGQK